MTNLQAINQNQQTNQNQHSLIVYLPDQQEQRKAKLFSMRSECKLHTGQVRRQEEEVCLCHLSLEKWQDCWEEWITTGLWGLTTVVASNSRLRSWEGYRVRYTRRTGWPCGKRTCTSMIQPSKCWNACSGRDATDYVCGQWYYLKKRTDTPHITIWCI